jgi:hypothetical protein
LSGDRRIKAAYGSAGGCEPSFETSAKRLCAHGGDEGDKHDQNGVFDSYSTALMTEKAFDQTAH